MPEQHTHRSRKINKVLVVHGAGMELRGKVDVHVFGTMTMDDYNVAIEGFAAELGLKAEPFHTLDPELLVARLETARQSGFDAIVINPAGYTVGHPTVARAIGKTGLPAVEVHISNPARRAVVSDVAPAVTGTISGFGVEGYRLAFRGLLSLQT